MRIPIRFLRILIVAFGLLVAVRHYSAELAPPAPPTREELGTWLTAHVTQPRFSGALWGLKIVSLETGAT